MDRSRIPRRLDRRARHSLSREDLLEGLRLEHVESPARVRLATLGANGRISVVPLGE